MTPTATTFGEWVIGLYGFAILILLGLQIASYFRRKPPIEAEFATKEELGAVVKTLDQFRDVQHGYIGRGECERFRSSTDGAVETLRSSLYRGQRELLDKMDSVKSELSIIDERRISAVYERLSEISDAVARVDERTKNLTYTPRP